MDLYRRLQQHLNRAPVGFPATASGVELRILQRLFTPDDAEIALELSSIPEPAATIHKRLRSRLSLADLTAKLDRMAAKGIVLAHPIQGRLCYAKLIYVVGMYERQIKTLTTGFLREHRQYVDEAFLAAFHTGKTPQLRVVPVNKQIAIERGVTTYDQIRAHVESSPGPFGTLTCICRHGQDLLGESCRQTALRDNCLMIGPAATWAADSGNGRATTREEILALLDRADQDGLVLQPENTKSPMFVCCCCGCCCNVLTSAKRLPSPAAYFSSNFCAAADPDACISCGVCEMRCQMEAISSPDGKAVVDRSRCIGCALCVSTCPSGAMRLEPHGRPKLPPDDTPALYVRMFRDRYGAAGLAKLGAKKMLGLKI
ncbi:MAG: 4Fe-4S dicluster domain-containing protein [Bryobacteraceae bacterium]|jgi:ferredoxin